MFALNLTLERKTFPTSDLQIQKTKFETQGFKF